MTEPTQAASGSLLLAALTTSLGPLAGEWVLIIIGAFVGAFLAVTAMETFSVKRAAIVLFRGLAMSVLFTKLAAMLAAPYLGPTVEVLLLPVAGIIGWKQDKLAATARSFLQGKKGMP